MTPEMLATLTEQVAELVQTYSNNYPQFQRATYNETQFCKPLLQTPWMGCR